MILTHTSALEKHLRQMSAFTFNFKEISFGFSNELFNTIVFKDPIKSVSILNSILADCTSTYDNSRISQI